MNWLREILKANGIEVSDELIADVQKEAPKHLIPKTEFNLKLDEISGLKGQLEQRDADIEELKTKASSADDLTTQLTELQSKYTKDTDDLQAQLKQTKFNSALDVALAGAGAKNTKALRALLDMEKISYEDDALHGFTEQLEQIKSENDYLFESSKPGATGIRHDGSGGSDDPFVLSARSAAGLKD